MVTPQEIVLLLRELAEGFEQQAAAEMRTVLASDMGPVWVAEIEGLAAYHRHISALLFEAERIVSASTGACLPGLARPEAQRSSVAEAAGEQSAESGLAAFPAAAASPDAS
jgi:hypothetical protein